MKSEQNDSSDRTRDRSPMNSNTDKNDDDDSNVSGGAKDRSRDRDRDRQRRGDRPSRFAPRNSSTSRDRDRGGRKGGAADRRIFVSNIAYEFRWQELKDLFRTEVGEVAYVELFNDENDKPRGCGIVEFESADSVKKAVEKMHRFQLKGRKLVVKEDYDVERDKYGRPLKSGGGGSSGGGGGGGGGSGGGGGGGNSDINRMRDALRIKWESPALHQSPLASLAQSTGSATQKWGNTYGLSPQFLESLWITGPLVTRVFVANLDYKVDSKKLKEVFKIAGKVANVELSLDKEGKSRGFGVVEYEHPVEAVQAISMFHNQMLYDRKLTVRMDRVDHKLEGPPKLPEGLRGLGMGLGASGAPLQDVARNLPNSQQVSSSLVGAVPTAAATLGAGLGLGGSGAALQASLAGVGGLGAGALVGGGTADMGLSASLGATAFGSSGLGGALGSAVSGIGGGNTSLQGGNSYGSGLGGLTSNSYIGGVSGVGYGTSSSSGLIGGSYGGNSRDFDVSALGGSSYGAGVGERDYRGSGGGSSNYVNGPGRGGLGSLGGTSGGGTRSSDTVIVKNLPPSTTWQMLRDKFREVGDVEFAEIRGKDIGLLRFKSEWDAERAVHMMDRSRLEGRTIDVCLFY